MNDTLYKKALDLPQKPGIYQMLDKDGEILYVGKAKSLKHRVSSYFTGRHDSKTMLLVSKVCDFAVILCKSEFEALVLESSLIKAHRPRYNILLKDDKGYPYVRLNMAESYPRFTMTAKKAVDGARYFGPYGKRGVTRDAIFALGKALKLPGCSRKFPRDIGKARPCLNLHMRQCLGYCQKAELKQEHDRAIAEAIMVLEGKTGDLMDNLKQEMEQAAEDTQFELAAQLRDRIRAIALLRTRQNVVVAAAADTDVIGYCRGAAKSAFVVLRYIGGHLLGKDYELVDIPLDVTEAQAVSILVRQYYLRSESYPRAIYLPFVCEDIELMTEMFSEHAGHRVELFTPQRGKKRELVDTAMENAKIEVERADNREEKVRGILQWLQKALGLDLPPMRVEAFDVSHLGASDIVAAMTVFYNAKPLKKDYRKFKINSTQTPDDYQSMKEVLTRRFQRYVDGDMAFADLPDLLLIDGGAAHAALAAAVVDEFGLDVSVFGMVKDDKHKTRALIAPDGREIGIAAVPQVFSFIGQIQEETHRAALDYQKSLRQKRYGSSLDDIPGVGPARRDKLLREFKTIKRIKDATLDELTSVVPRNTAEAILRYFSRDIAEG